MWQKPRIELGSATTFAACGIRLLHETKSIDSSSPPYTLSQNELNLRPLEVVVDGDNVERAIKALKRKVAHEGIYKELKRRRFYEKPSVKRKRKQREAERRRRKERRRALRANVRRR